MLLGDLVLERALTTYLVSPAPSAPEAPKWRCPSRGPGGGLGATPRPLQLVQDTSSGWGQQWIPGNLLEKDEPQLSPTTGLAAPANCTLQPSSLIPFSFSLFAPPALLDLLASQGRREGQVKNP